MRSEVMTQSIDQYGEREEVEVELLRLPRMGNAL
jgi:hypothetical protein